MNRMHTVAATHLLFILILIIILAKRGGGEGELFSMSSPLEIT